jgi:hypothetical protein
MPDSPADPSRDQTAMRLRDLYRLRELIQVHGRGGTLHIPSLPQPARSEAEQILDRVGELNSDRQEQRQKILLTVANAEAYLEALPDDPANARKVRQLRRRIAQLRSQLTGLPPNPDESQP